MRAALMLLLLLVTAFGGCARPPTYEEAYAAAIAAGTRPPGPDPNYQPPIYPAAPIVALTPEQQAQRAYEAAKAARESELLERALSSSPDYSAALRRAAVANVTEEPQPLQGRRPRETAQAREQRIAAEEVRLSDAIEVRRRDRLRQREADQARQRAQQAVYECQARGAQIEASMFNPRSILNLDAAIAGAQAREACLSAYGLRR